MDFLELAGARYSVRKYAARPVEKEKLDRILEAGNLAPTAKNLQPQRVYVLRSEEALKKVAELTPCGFGAPVVLLFTYSADEEWKNPLQEGIRSGVEDVSIVATHVMLAAASIGLGTCWVNFFANRRVEEAFGIPKNERSVLLMPVGYPAEDSAPAAMHGKCKPLAETVRYL